MSHIFFLTIRPQPRSTLFPYTTLFRSHHAGIVEQEIEAGLAGQFGGEPFHRGEAGEVEVADLERAGGSRPARPDRKSTRLNSSHVENSYAVFCLKKKI